MLERHHHEECLSFPLNVVLGQLFLLTVSIVSPNKGVVTAAFLLIGLKICEICEL